MPTSTVIPVLVYEDVDEAVEWLCDTFGFQERWRVGNHRAQLTVGDGAVVVGERRVAEALEGNDPTIFRAPRRGEVSHSILVRVEDDDVVRLDPVPLTAGQVVDVHALGTGLDRVVDELVDRAVRVH